MVAIIGLIIVFASVVGGFTMAGGPIPVLIVWSEYLVIGGTAVGTVVIVTASSRGIGAGYERELVRLVVHGHPRWIVSE